MRETMGKDMVSGQPAGCGKLRLAFLLVLVVVVVGPGSVFGRDPEGCLTCHQYPGLVRHEKDDHLTVLHIDENLYYQSAHRKFNCKSCHTRLNQVPHTGETHVECNAKCHLTEKDQKMLRRYDYKSLHRKEQSHISRLDDGSACRACHPLYPHKENKLVRALVNMHTGFMYCETCHIKRDQGRQLSYRWTDSEKVEFVGEPFGSRFNPQLDHEQKLAHFISRITVCEVQDGVKHSLVNTEDTAKAKGFMARQQKLKPAARKKELDYYHRDIAKKEISVACDECHSDQGMLDFAALGFDDKQAHKLKTLNVKGLVTHYKTFYFPQMLPH